MVATDIESGLDALLAISGELRRGLVRLVRRYPNAAELLLQARRLIAHHEPILARTLRDSLLTSYLDAARKWGKRAVAKPEAVGMLPPVLPPPFRSQSPADPEEPLIRFPMIERAAQDLLQRELMLPEEFAELNQDAKRTAFTVARAQSLETVRAVHEAILDDIREGGTLRLFRERVNEALSPILSPPQVETLYRTQTAQAAGAGLRTVLEHPLVADEFPYVLWVATHDTRVRPDHLEMEHHGQNGTAVYRSDDPMWLTLWPPAGYNCRCAPIPLSLEDAARHGSREAQHWLQTGIAPAFPEFAVRPYPIQPPPGWPTSGTIASVL